jgi:hypothetical protein
VAAAAAAAAAGAASGQDAAGPGSAARLVNGIGIIGSSKLLGVAPDTGAPVWVKRGPFGLYIQLVSQHVMTGTSHYNSSLAASTGCGSCVAKMQTLLVSIEVSSAVDKAAATCLAGSWQARLCPLGSSCALGSCLIAESQLWSSDLQMCAAEIFQIVQEGLGFLDSSSVIQGASCWTAACWPPCLQSRSLGVI